ncbi:MAG TPA: hypothetical protein VHT91_19230 [Kofleriaceae bacterium]|nr:hypothetical protein [Kofleriaceae bacterium]
MIESFVDLTYRGLSLGRRVRLSQVRPSTGYLELPAPMPVGSQIAIAAEDGTAFDAVVTAIFEQVAGADRTPGMIVAPALVAEPASAWWAARVSLPDDDAVRPRTATGSGRSRPATVRPRSHTTPTPPPMPGATIDEVPTIIADLDARVAAAAGVPPRPDGDRSAMRTMVMPLSEIEALTAASAADPGAPDPAILQPTGDHAVVDDGKPTVIMQPIDPAALGLAAPGLAAPGLAASAGAPARDPGSAEPDADGGPDADGDPDDDADGDAGGDTEPPDTLKDAPTARPARGPRRRRSRR